MNVEVPELEWKRVIKYTTRPSKLCEHLSEKFTEHQFVRDEQTDWAYRKVATFLEDGWTSQAEYTTLRDGAALDLGDLGRVVNVLVRGCRPDKALSRPEGANTDAPYVFDGERPNVGDLAAFVFFCACQSPEEVV